MQLVTLMPPHPSSPPILATGRKANGVTGGGNSGVQGRLKRGPMTERFTLLSEVGRGGMGVVWKARDEETGQIVALKLLRDSFAEDPSYRARFERELEIARRITSDHVVKVLGLELETALRTSPSNSWMVRPCASC